jgi:hypothetical protein
MKGRYWNLLMMCIFVLSIAACSGGSGGSPGTSGSEETGILIKAASVSKESPDIDVFQNPTLCDGEPEDAITREDANIDLDLERINPNVISDPLPASVEECTITYLKANQDPAAPILDSLTIYPNCILGDGTNSCAVTLIDISRKTKYANDVLFQGINAPAEYPTHYVARYYCKYKNNFGDEGFFQVEFDMWLADFDTCA